MFSRPKKKKKIHSLGKKKKGGKKFQLPPAPWPRPSSTGLVSIEKRGKDGMLFTRTATPLILPLSFRLPLSWMKHRKQIESIQWLFRQWRMEILRALLDMKIYNKNQFLASLCSLNDKAPTHSTHCAQESNSKAPGVETRAAHTFWPTIADFNMIQDYWDNRRHLISSVEKRKKKVISYLLDWWIGGGGWDLKQSVGRIQNRLRWTAEHLLLPSLISLRH